MSFLSRAVLHEGFPLHTKTVYWETVTNTFVVKYT